VLALEVPVASLLALLVPVASLLLFVPRIEHIGHTSVLVLSEIGYKSVSYNTTQKPLNIKTHNK
jgi:hypothetical protein